MRTAGMTEVLPLDKKQKALCSIVVGLILIAAGVLIALAGVGVLPASAGAVAPPTVLLGLFAAFLFTAAISKNSVSMWIAGIFFSCGLASLFAAVTTATYANLYPFYIASPGVGCAFAAVYAEAKMPPIKCALFFGGLAAVFSLSSSGAFSWGVTGGAIAAYFGVWAVLYAVTKFVKKDNDNA